MRWATGVGVRIDRAACAWPIPRCVDADARFVREADLDDERYAAREAPGGDAVPRGLSTTCDDERILELTGAMSHRPYEYHRRGLRSGREPA